MEGDGALQPLRGPTRGVAHPREAPWGRRGVRREESAGDGDEEKQTPTRRFFPSSVGLSVLVPGDTEFLNVTVCWGDYARTEDPDDPHHKRVTWGRTPRREILAVTPALLAPVRAATGFAERA